MFFSETQREIVFTFYYFCKFNNDEEGKQFTVSIPRISTIQNIGNQPIDDNIKSGNEKVCPSLSKLVQACPSLRVENEETTLTLFLPSQHYLSSLYIPYQSILSA